MMTSRLWIAIQFFIIIIFHGGRGIYNGEIAENGRFKYMVLIHRLEEDGFSICGGAIIDQLHILTAAHCVLGAKEDDLLVFAGASNLVDLASRRWEVKKIHVHGDFQPEQSINCMELHIRRLFSCVLDKPEMRILPKNDVAVLKLTDVLPLGENLTKVQLPENNSLPYCQELEYAGWGDVEHGTPSSRLQYSRLMIFDRRECNRREVFHRNEQFCGIALNRRSSIAFGDSGGPLVDGNTVYGITTFIDPKDPDVPAGFTKVFSHRRFIEKAMDN